MADYHGRDCFLLWLNRQWRVFRKICLPSFTQTLVILRKIGENRHALALKKWPKTNERAELAQNRGQIRTQHAKKNLYQPFV